jgi:nucleoside-diphosphate-sugar epimerase
MNGAVSSRGCRDSSDGDSRSMKVLVIGGTRLLGRSVVRHLVESEHWVTVVSRRAANCSAGATYLGMDRSVGLDNLEGESFDIVVDFLAYDGVATAHALAKIQDAAYVLISSAWVPRLHPDARVDEPVVSIDQGALESLPAITRGYLSAKREAESVVFQARRAGRRATVLRLPIFFGEGDHTGRVEFYRRRGGDDGAVVCVNGGHNLAQIAWTEDLARALRKWLQFATREPLWDGTADRGSPVREIIAHLVRGTGRVPSLVDVPAELLARHLPLYLENEPLWREVSFEPGERNIFSATGIVPTPQSEWLPRIKGAPDRSPSQLRAMELKFIEQLQRTG